MDNQLTQNANNSIFSAESMNQMVRFADLMSQGVTMLPAHLQGKPADCMAVAIQAASWGMSPFVVAQKTHLVNGTLGYEAQLVNAVISSSKAIVGRFHYKTIGDWSKWKYKNVGTQKVKHGGLNESGLGVQVGAVLAGDTEVTWDDVLYIEHIDIRNSPLWKSRPLQQLKYLAVKYWARLYAPEVILGVYTADELQQPSRVEKEVNAVPASNSLDINDLVNQTSTVKAELVPDSDDVNDIIKADNQMTKHDEMKALISTASSRNELVGYRRDIETQFNDGELTDDEFNDLKARIKRAHDAI